MLSSVYHHQHSPARLVQFVVCICIQQVLSEMIYAIKSSMFEMPGLLGHTAYINWTQTTDHYQ